jgi:hypothetical protein
VTFDRRASRRWERLSEVLHELDDLRERGERLLSPVPDGAVAESAGRGDEPHRRSDRKVAMAKGRSSKDPSKRSRVRPRRSTNQPDRLPTRTVVADRWD